LTFRHNLTFCSVEAKPVDDARPTISWRGNGEMFVVNYWVDNKRAFVVFETPCKALFRSEECPGLQQLIAWRPTGNMIATLAITDRESIVIFEKNGQKRFSFDLDFGTVSIDLTGEQN
jgi:elongator complex protein 1